MIECQLRVDLGSINNSRRAQVVISEFIDIVFLNNENPCRKDQILTTLDIIKSVLILDSD